MRVAVVGHVEWVEFVRVERVPRPGEIVHAIETWEEPAGGGAVAAVQLAKLAGSCTLFTALGDDELGRRSPRGAEAARRRRSTRRAPSRSAARSRSSTTTGERTITVLGREAPAARRRRPAAVGELAGCDASTSSAATPTRSARARRRASSSRRRASWRRSARPGVELDVLVGSGDDEGERYEPGELEPPPQARRHDRRRPRRLGRSRAARSGRAAPRARSRTPTAAATPSPPG